MTSSVENNKKKREKEERRSLGWMRCSFCKNAKGAPLPKTLSGQSYEHIEFRNLSVCSKCRGNKLSEYSIWRVIKMAKLNLKENIPSLDGNQKKRKSHSQSCMDCRKPHNLIHYPNPENPKVGSMICNSCRHKREVNIKCPNMAEICKM
jgi:hypothetical protein